MNRAKTAISGNLKAILLIVAAIAGLWWYHGWQEDRYQRATVMQQSQLQSLNEIENRLHTSEQNAIALQDRIKQINAGRVQPVTNYYVSTPTVQQAAEKVQEQINSKDPSVPPELLAEADRNVVTPNPERQKVDVYKINLDKRMEISVGVGYHDGIYMPVEIQRNIGRNKAASVELHFDPGGIAGGEVKTTYRF